MKELSIAIVLVTASVTFANAQTTENVKKEQSEATMTTAAEMKADTTVVAPAADAEVSMDAMKAEPVEATKESPAEMKQKARDEKKAARKAGK